MVRKKSSIENVVRDEEWTWRAECKAALRDLRAMPVPIELAAAWEVVCSAVAVRGYLPLCVSVGVRKLRARLSAELIAALEETGLLWASYDPMTGSAVYLAANPATRRLVLVGGDPWYSAEARLEAVNLPAGQREIARVIIQCICGNAGSSARVRFAPWAVGLTFRHQEDAAAWFAVLDEWKREGVCDGDLFDLTALARLGATDE